MYQTARCCDVFGELGAAKLLLKTLMNQSGQCKVTANIVLDGFIQAKHV